MNKITDKEVAWLTKTAPALARQLCAMWNEVYMRGVSNRDLHWDKGWNPIFQCRYDLLETTVSIYALGKLFRVFGTELRKIAMPPGSHDVTLKAPAITSPFEY